MTPPSHLDTMNFMSTHIAIGFSQASDIQEAAYQACTSAKNQLNAPQTNLVIVFACTPYAADEALAIVHTVLRPQRLIGSSTAGIILSEGTFNRGIAVLAINSDEIDFGIACSRFASDTNLRTAGFDLGRKMNADFKTHQRQACLMFTDTVFQNNSQFIHGAQEVLGLGFHLLGGVSSDDLKSKKNCQLYQKQVLSKSAVGLLLGGAAIGVGYAHGFKPLGKPRTITKARNNIIHTIDDKPALHIYEEYLGPEAEQIKKGNFSPHSILYPLGIYMEQHRQYLLKNAVDILSDGSIVCQGEVPEGAEVHLMIGNRESCTKSTADAATQAKESLGDRLAKCIIIIESVARHKILKNNSFLEVQIVKEILGHNIPVIGMYSLGEIVPLGAGHVINNTYIQNESILILAISE